MGKVTVQIGWKLNGAIQLSQEREIGSIPIMVKVTQLTLIFG